MKTEPVIHFNHRKELREWLQANSRTAQACWVVCSRSAQVPPGVLPYLDVVEEAKSHTCRKKSSNMLEYPNFILIFAIAG